MVYVAAVNNTEKVLSGVNKNSDATVQSCDLNREAAAAVRIVLSCSPKRVKGGEEDGRIYDEEW